MYSEAILEQKLDMDTVIHEIRNPNKYQEDLDRGLSQVEILNETYQQDKANWHDYAQYAKFLSDVYEYGSQNQ